MGLIYIYIMESHSFTQRVETAVTFDTTERTRGHAEETVRNGNAADFIREATGSNFDCDTRISWVSPDVRLFFQGDYGVVVLIQAVILASVVVLIFHFLIWHFWAYEFSASPLIVVWKLSLTETASLEAVNPCGRTFALTRMTRVMEKLPRPQGDESVKFVVSFLSLYHFYVGSFRFHKYVSRLIDRLQNLEL